MTIPYVYFVIIPKKTCVTIRVACQHPDGTPSTRNDLASPTLADAETHPDTRLPPTGFEAHPNQMTDFVIEPPNAYQVSRRLWEQA